MTISPSVIESGNPSGIPIIFIHGFPFHSGMWKQQMEAFQNQSHFHAIAYDMRGFGNSPLHGQFFIENLADDLIEFLGDKDGPVIACGFSMGGYVLLRAVAKEPNLFRGLILADTRAESDSDDAKLKRAKALYQIQIEDGLHQFTDAFLKQVFAASTFESNSAVVDEMRALILTQKKDAICTALLALAARVDSTPILSEIGVPTLVMTGEFDQLTPVAVGRSMHEKIKNSEYHSIQNAGHMAPLENSAAFNSFMFNFLKKHFN